MHIAIDPPTIVTSLLVAAAFFLAGWRAHRWHTFTRWPRRPRVLLRGRR